MSTYSATETPPPGGETELKIRKLEAGTNTPLSGAVFEVKYPDGGTVGSFATGSDGTITIPLTITGNYTVTETVAPADHLLPETRTQNVTVTHGKTATVTFVDAPYGNLRVEKYSDTGEALKGVTIQIKNIATGATWSAQTSSAGVALFTELPVGGYEVRETAGIEGWQLDGEAVQTVAVTTGATSTVTFINKELPGLRIVKYDRTTLQTMSGVTFEIYKDGAYIGRYTTNAMGEILLTNAVPGTYLVREVQSADTHITDTTPQEIELSAGDGIRQLVFFNDRKPGIHLVKVDSANLSKPIANARFRIEAADGSYGPIERTTGADGTIDLSRLPVGAYVVTELSCPGYVIDNAQRIIRLDGNETAEFVFTNSIRPTLHLRKLSSDGMPLAGVAFRIAKIEDGTRYLDRTTDANGEITIDDLDPGVYSVRETATRADHVLDTRAYHVELFAGKTSTLVVENQKRPNLTVYKYDADTGEPIADTVFTVRAADGHSVDEIRTDRSGKATLANLLPGVYEIVEKSVPSDWLPDAPSELVTLYANRDHTAYFYNHRKPSLTVQKISSVTGEALKGAKFHVEYASNNTTTGERNDLGYYYTGDDGTFTLTHQRDGWYKVTEVTPPTGYELNAEPEEFFLAAGKSKTVTFENVPLSALVVFKYDSVTGEAVKNAVFQVKYLSGTSGTGGTVIGTYKTGANGSFTVTNLKAGTYTIEELASDSGHVIDTAPQTAFLSGKDQDVVSLYFGNAPKGSLLIRKIDSATHAPLSDVRFYITDSTGAVVGDGNGYYVTDSAGTILIDGIAPGTTLIAKEAAAKDGYVLDDTPQTAYIKAGKTVTLEFRNAPKGGLIIRKHDSVTGAPLGGAVFRVTTSDGRYADNYGGYVSSNGLYTTAANGQIQLYDLTPGTYVVTEVKAPDNYKLDATPQTVRVNAADTQTLSFANDPLCTLTIYKRDSVTKEPLARAEFSVAYSNGEVIGTGNGRYITGTDGSVIVSGLKPDATIIVTETKAPSGYIKDATPKSIVVRSGAANSLTFDNEPTTTLVIRKYIEGTDYEPLAGVCFKVTDGSGAAVGPDDGEYYTDAAGEIVLTGLEPGITVKAREIKTVEGYVLDGTPQVIMIHEGRVQQLTFWNARQGTLVIRKLDSITKAPLAGAEFSVRYADGRFVDNANGHISSNGIYNTNRNGEIVITGLTGTVVVAEEKAPDGYLMDTNSRTQTVTVNADDTQTLVFYNTPVGGLTITKSDEDTGERISGVKFEVRKQNGEIIGTYITDRNGVIRLPQLEKGWYAVTELKAASGYKLDATPQSVEVKDGQTSTLELTNERYSAITIHKTDAVTGEGIYGVTFMVYNSAKRPVEQLVTDQDGYARTETQLLSGRYYVREMQAADGYLTDTENKTVTLRTGKESVIEWKNTPITGQIMVQKYAAEYNAVTGTAPGTPLSGAVYEIVDVRTGKVVDNIATDARGVAASKPLPLKRYQVKEVTAPTYWQVDSTVHDVTLEFAGQIVKISSYDKPAQLGVVLTKTGLKEVLAGNKMTYTFTVANTSNVSLTGFYFHDKLPYDVTGASVLTTGTYSARLNYRILYKTNLNDYRVLASNLLSTNNYAFQMTGLPLMAGEVVTDVYYDFGAVPAGFQSVAKPTLTVSASPTAVNGYQVINRADAGGMYAGTWQTANASWVTFVRNLTPVKPKTLPKTGF